MARPGKAADLRAAKERKQKKIAIVGGILLVAVLAIQVPRTMSMLGGEEEATAEEPIVTTAAPATPPSGPVSLEPPSLAGGGTAPAPAAAAAGELPGAEPAPLATSGQLISFSRFESKDPFAQQLDEAAATPENGGEERAAKGGKDGGGGGEEKPPETPLVARAAVISIDGEEETVAPGGDFPAATPLFTLVSLTKTSAAIAIAGGSYADGAKTVTLKRGEPLTLMNTADGVRYELKLVSFIWGSALQS